MEEERNEMRWRLDGRNYGTACNDKWSEGKRVKEEIQKSQRVRMKTSEGEKTEEI